MLSVFRTAHLLRVNDYEFEDGGADRDKYVIVLYSNDDDSYLIHCLTTKNNRFNAKNSSFGCNEVSSRHYWFYPKGRIVGEKNYHFRGRYFCIFPSKHTQMFYFKIRRSRRKGDIWGSFPRHNT